MLDASNIIAAAGVLDDAVSVDPEVVDINGPHVVEDAVENAVSYFRTFKLLAARLLNEIRPHFLTLVP